MSMLSVKTHLSDYEKYPSEPRTDQGFKRNI